MITMDHILRPKLIRHKNKNDLNLWYSNDFLLAESIGLKLWPKK